MWRILFRNASKRYERWTEVTTTLLTSSEKHKLPAIQVAFTGAAAPTQQLRMYVPQTVRSDLTACWNCKKIKANEEDMICAACGHLQDISGETLFNSAETFNLEASELTRHFRQLQAIVHPDKFSNKSSREQKNSADWSSLINKAYKTLSVPIQRGQYLLELQGEHMPEDNSVLNQTLLMEMMERNEEVEEANSTEALLRLNEQVKEEIKVKIVELGAKFSDNELEAVKGILVEMKYLLRIQATIKNKLQSLMGNIQN